MSILINKNTRVVCQGLTGKKGSFHSDIDMKYGTKIVSGVVPGKGNTYHLGIPIFDTVKEAVFYTKANTSVIYVPAIFCKEAILEAVDSGIELIIVITEGIPILDMMVVKKKLQENQDIIMIGPNSPGIISPGQCKIGIQPYSIHKIGAVGIISRSGTLMYEAVDQISRLGIGQSTCVGIGGDMISGCDFIEILPLFEDDIDTKVILMIGEIGGNREEKAASYIQSKVTKPVLAYIAGLHVPRDQQMGHAGAILENVDLDIEEKMKFLEKNGIEVIQNISKIGENIRKYF
ncbi:succinate--CoA ligase subunit alpha [Candidatus Riesia pediculicola]|uniref:Succinyl-CoA synthetase alpha chain n=1 Tax=Riesia pediculicola (strain USDA) TaxID=515618 RepID=D4G839_RIEPU|nr:succinate--CoA ligase subunit alpha [Candidatus Riesia pediculicola]ADD79522.1 succinyl-CoA synthetase alpha chain [Candidatus Riesia pediculicola USDA]QOJ86384.1 succinate--CoA ligase subunit alpha [Candidatus Riesia pediculicola]